jgi:hypothetical protein
MIESRKIRYWSGRGGYEREVKHGYNFGREI